MRERAERVVTVLRAIVYEVRTEKVTFLAGSVAYHAFISMLPLLLLLLAVVSSIGNRTLTDGMIHLTQAVLTPGASELLLHELRRAGRSTGISLFGALVLLWGTLRIFRGLDTAFSDVYDTEVENTLTDQVSDGFVVFVTFGLAVVATGAIFDAIPSGTGSVYLLLEHAALVVGLALVLLPMYYIFPDTDVSMVEVLPGTFFAATGLTIFESLFRLYLRYSSRQPTQSVIAGVLVLLTWLYFSGLVLLVGVAINAVLSNRSADVNVAPVIGGVPVEEETGPSDRTRVVDSVDELDGLLDPPRELTISVGERSVSLPAPQHVRIDTEQSSLSISDEPIGVELRWTSAGELENGSPADESSSAEGPSPDTSSDE